MGEPVDVLQELARESTRIGRDVERADVVLKTHQALGLIHEHFTFDCPVHHYDEIVSSVLSQGMKPQPFRLVGSKEGRPTVQEVFKSMAADSTNGRASQHQEKPCPLCYERGGGPSSLAQGTRRGSLVSKPQDLFFAITEPVPHKSSPDTGIAPSHALAAFGDTYSLCGVVYITGGRHHCQTQFFLPQEGWWMTYNDRKDSEAARLSSFDAEYCRGQEHMFLYIRSDLLRTMNCHNTSPDGGSGNTLHNIPADSYRPTRAKEAMRSGRKCPGSRPATDPAAADTDREKGKANQVPTRHISQRRMFSTP